MLVALLAQNLDMAGTSAPAIVYRKRATFRVVSRARTMSIETRIGGFRAEDRLEEYGIARTISIDNREGGVRPQDRDNVVSIFSRSADVTLVMSEEE